MSRVDIALVALSVTLGVTTAWLQSAGDRVAYTNAAQFMGGALAPPVLGAAIGWIYGRFRRTSIPRWMVGMSAVSALVAMAS